MASLFGLFTHSRDGNPRDFRGLAVFAATLALFFISGGCGLLYQVVWTRKLVLLFGTTSYAVGTVLSIFFLGLGVGSLWGGRLADRTSRPLAWYGWFQLVIGLWGLLFILSVVHAEGFVVYALRSVAGHRAVAVGVRALLALAFLCVPVTLMGATLPLLARFVTTSARARGLRIGALYSVNTFGAVAGCAFTGFVLIAQFGYMRTTFIGAAANAVAGGLALLLSHLAREGRAAVADAPRKPVPDADADGEALSRGRLALALTAFAVSGFCALALEVLWTRLLVLVFLGTTYAFTTMLTSLLCGIACGSAVAALFADRVKRPYGVFGLCQVLIGLTCLYMLVQFDHLPEWFNTLRRDAGYNWTRMTWVKFRVSFALLFVPTFLFGLAFPFVVRAVTQGAARLGRDVGRLYSVNTFGGVLGSLAGGFLIIPVLGTHLGIIVLSGMLVLMGMALLLAQPGAGAARRFVPVAAALAGAVAIGAILPRDVGFSLNQTYLPEDQDIIHYREGVEGTVLVTETQGAAPGTDRYLWINAMQATASIEKGVRMNRLQGALPLLFEHAPRKVLFMCFGSGITAGALGLYDDFDRIDAVELSRDVLDAAPLFRLDNLDVLDNPRLDFIVDDGRNFLLTTRERYDVITFEPMPLAQAGVSTFYTREYYRLCLDRLVPGGLVSQWVPLHSLNPEIVRSLVGTFVSVFPDACAWFVNADLFLIGSNEPLAMDYATLERRLAQPRVRAALEAVGFHDLPELICCYFMGRDALLRFTEGGSHMSDDRPWAEFIAPKLVYENTVDQSLRELAPHLESPLDRLRFDGLPPDTAERLRAAVERRHEARRIGLQGLEKYYGAMMGGDAEQDFMRALDVDPDDYNAKYYLREIVGQRAALYARWEEHERGVELLTQVLEYLPEDADLVLALSEFYRGLEQPEQAEAMRRRYIELGGQDPGVAP